MLMRLEALSSGDFSDVSIVEAASTFEIDDRRQPVTTGLPGSQLHFQQVLDKITAHCRQAFRLLPPLIRRLVGFRLLDHFSLRTRHCQICVCHDLLHKYRGPNTTAEEKAKGCGYVARTVIGGPGA